MQLYNIVIRAIPGFILLIIIEAVQMVKEHLFEKDKKNLWASVQIGIVASSINVCLQGFIFLTYSIVYEYRIFTIHPVWIAFAICFFADDFTYYVFHRASHKIRFFWASHIVHHSSELFSPSAALRIPWTSNLTGTFLFWAWIPFIGIEPGVLVTMKAISVLYQFWLHTESIRKMPRWFEVIFNTPSHHRLHHSSEVQYLDKNHGGTLILWDKMLGTFMPETGKTKYGLTKNITSHNPAAIALHEWKSIFKDVKKAGSFSEALNYVFNSPGWSNDGSSKTAREKQAEAVVHPKEMFSSPSASPQFL